MRDSSENFLRYAWEYRLLSLEELTTTDGRPLTIVFPGNPNPDGGPDFIEARVQIGSTLFVGDVEVHCNPLAWYTHHHHNDPHYNRVILHVVGSAPAGAPAAITASRRVLPVLAMGPFLLPQAKSAWIQEHRSQHHHTSLPCAQRALQIPWDDVALWLRSCAHQRMERRIRLLQERLQELVGRENYRVGEPRFLYCGNPDEIPPPTREYSQRSMKYPAFWDQLLYEGIVEAMGFSKNREAFRMLAHNIPLSLVRLQQNQENGSVFALLFGASGLLPSSREPRDPASRRYVRHLRRLWRDIRPTLRRPLLHEGDWRFFRLRPVNFPTARLAALSYLVSSFFQTLGGFQYLVDMTDCIARTPRECLQALHETLRIHPEDFWRTHTHFRTTKPGQGISLGAGRRNAIIISAILPLLLLHGRLFGKDDVISRAEGIFSTMPALKHGIPRVLERDLVRGRILREGAIMEEGMRELYKHYCLPRRCNVCAMGQAVGANAKSKMKKEK